ncbi:unnamed protein product [Protopolystoma xenopodis]|uniref:Uncharacterized protein n=1 Tax=Protopolystoma xenopodis TaxID=117903 RepID=A0A3S5FDS3_9PLAT|nr:unnamed protein product [Protopolystoma xenopodis]
MEESPVRSHRGRRTVSQGLLRTIQHTKFKGNSPSVSRGAIYDSLLPAFSNDMKASLRSNDEVDPFICFIIYSWLFILPTISSDFHPVRDLLGHTGTVHGLSFSSDRHLIASGSADGTLRLWSTLVWGGCLTVWRDHLLPIWDVAWAPVYGHYIITGGVDRTARIYATGRH